MQNEGTKTYAKWQYEKGEDTIKFYKPFASKEEMFKDKTVLDIGCGAAGKTLFFATLGVKHIYGCEILTKYGYEAMKLAEELSLSDRFTFTATDAAFLPFEPCSIDTIIMNDTMEHVDNPKAVLEKCISVLKPGGRIYLNFPPYYHPYGAHLSDAIAVPWVHIFFSTKTLIQTYKDCVKHLPDGAERIEFRISKDSKGDEYFSYINKMTIRRFKYYVKSMGLKAIYYKEVPLRPFLKPFAVIPILKEMFVKMVVCVIEKRT